jgi:O-antigen/teichoic acid export membrane protein
MSRIVRNSVLNGVAMAVTSVLSLVLVPVLIGRYRLDDYGLIPLLRLLTPLGAFGLAALGLPAIATRVAGAAHADPERLRRAQSTLVAVSLLLGACACLVLLAIGWERFAGPLRVPRSGREAFALGFVLLSALMPLLFAGLLLTAALTGLGRFRVLRSVEVGVYVGYFSAAVTAAWLGLPIHAVLIALLVADGLRAAVLLIYARRSLLIALGAVARPDWRWLAAHLRDFHVLSSASVLGYTRKYLAPGSIALLFGPAGVGLYDAIERVPRAFKTLLGLVNTAALPHAIRLDAAANYHQLRSLLVRGTRLTLLCTLPLTAAVMFYSTPLISVWLGPGLAHAGVLLALLMVPFALDATLSIVTTASLARLSLMDEQNKITVIEIIAFVAALALLTPQVGQAAAYAATVLAGLVGYVLRVRVFLPAFDVDRGAWRTLLTKIVLGSAVGCGLVYLAVRVSEAGPLLTLSTAVVAALAGAATIVLLWTPEERRDLRSVYASLRGLLALRP